MRRRNRILAALLSLSLVIGLCPGLALAASGDRNGTWGTCNISFTAETGTLRVSSGRGEEFDSRNPKSPWSVFASSVERAVFFYDVELPYNIYVSAILFRFSAIC